MKKNRYVPETIQRKRHSLDTFDSKFSKDLKKCDMGCYIQNNKVIGNAAILKILSYNRA